MVLDHKASWYVRIPAIEELKAIWTGIVPVQLLYVTAYFNDYLFN